MKKSDSRRKKPDAFRKALSSVPESAFDGHTEFNRLSVKDTLLWLSQAAEFCR